MLIESSDQVKLHSDRQEQLQESSKYITAFLKSLEPNDAYNVNSCPTCENESTQFVFAKNGGEYSYCKNCEHVFLSKSLKASHLIDFYTNYPTSSMDWHKNESIFYSRIYNAGIEMINAYQNGRDILDIGCSSGMFLSIVQEQGFSGFGVEPNTKEASHAKNHGINVLGKTITDIPRNQKFDVITMWDVLEHINSPGNFVKSLKKYLKPGGVVFVQIPTCDSLAARIMREKSNMFDGIEHLTLFSKKSLDICFENAGFSSKITKTIITESFALKNYLSYESDPYLPSNNNNCESIEELIDFDGIEEKLFGYKIQACYRLES